MQTTHFTAHNRKIPVNCLVLLVGVLGSLGFVSSALAETKYEIKSGDSLSKIISQNYPNTPRRSHSIIIQDIIKNNPNAFSNKNANSLRLGKVLTLSDQDKIEGLTKKTVTLPETVAVTEEETVKESVETNASSTTNSVEKEKMDASTTAETISDVVAESSASEGNKKGAIQDSEAGNATTKESTSNDTVEAENNTSIENTATTESANNDAEKFELKIEDLNAEIEQLRTLITKYEAEQENTTKKETSSQDTAEVEKLQAELEQQRALVKKYETDQADNNGSDDKSSNSPELEDLQAENDQLRSLVTKYEAEEKTDSTVSAGSETTQDSEDLQAENEQLKALVKKYEADAEEQNTSAGGADNSAELATLNAKVEKLTQQNTQLQNEIKTTQTQLSASKQAVSTKTSTLSEQQSNSPDFWQKFSWILPLIAILIGLYLLLRLIKRIRDKKATKELKIALSSSPDTAKSNTAAAFSVDGSMLPTASTVEDAPIEEDSVEAGVKIDMAKAYLDLDDNEAAQELLQEAVVEGSTAQRTVAENLLKKL